MTNLEELEQLLSKWKAVFSKTPRSKVRAHNYAEGAVCGIETALNIIKKPSNTRMHVDTKAECILNHNVLIGYKYKFCYECGEPLSQ